MEIQQTLDQIKTLIGDLVKYKKTISEQVSVADKQISVIYHEIEKRNFDVVSGYKLLVKLQEQLRIRRSYKNELKKAQFAASYCSGILPGIEKAKLKIQKTHETSLNSSIELSEVYLEQKGA